MKNESSNKEICFFTPSYRNDLERLLLLRESIQKFCAELPEHVIAVPRSDHQIFKRSMSERELDKNCEIIDQESLVESAFYPTKLYSLTSKIVPSQAWRLRSQAGKAGWIIQQIAKLNSAKACSAKTILAIDSDVFFFRELEINRFTPRNARILLRTEPTTESARHRKHMENAYRTLEIKNSGTEHHYMACPAILQREWLFELQTYLSEKKGKPWQSALAELESISEYSIYGVFVENILQPSDLFIEKKRLNLVLWDRKSAETFFDNPEAEINNHPDKICVTVQSNIGIESKIYETKLRQLLEQKDNHSTNTIK